MDIQAQKFKKKPIKSTRKVKGERKFQKSSSVFKDYKEETKEMCKKQLEYDAGLNKIARFIKDPEEL